MAYRRQLGDLIALCQQRVGRQNDGSIADADWKRYFSNSYGQLWGEVSQTANRYFETSELFTTLGAPDANNANAPYSYQEPSDHFMLIGVDRMIDNTGTGRCRPLFQLEIQERNVYAGQSGEAIGYSMVDDQLFLFPTPPAGQMYRWIYTPVAPKYGDVDGSNNPIWVDDTTPIDVVEPNGEAFCIWDVAVQVLAAEEADVTVATREREGARARLKMSAVLRNITTAHHPVREGGLSRDPAEWPDSGGGWGRY